MIVQNMYTEAEISDHDIPITECNLKPSQNKNGQIKIYNHNTSWRQNIKKESTKFKETFLKEYTNNNVSNNFRKFKTI